MLSRWLILPLMLMLLAAQAFAQEPDANGCKDHQLFSRFPGFYIQRCTVNGFGAHAFRAGKKEVTVEGRYTEIMYYKNENAKAPSPAHYPQLFSSRSCCAKHESGAHHLQTSIALPHQLMTRRGIIGSAKVAAQLSDQTHGLPQQQGLGQFFLPSP